MDSRDTRFKTPQGIGIGSTVHEFKTADFDMESYCWKAGSTCDFGRLDGTDNDIITRFGFARDPNDPNESRVEVVRCGFAASFGFGGGGSHTCAGAGGCHPIP